MSGMDAAFLYLETPNAHLHVVGVVLLEPPPGAPFGLPEVRGALAERLHLIPPLRRRALPPPGGLDHPVWIEDPDFDLSAHLEAATLDPPGDWAALEHFVGEFAGVQLDRSRPLWRIAVVDGLADGRVAMVAKLHHAIMDGAAGGELMASLFDLTPEPGAVAPPEEPWRPDRPPSGPALLVSSVTSWAARQKDVPAAVARTFAGLAATARTFVAQRAKGRRVALTAPRTALNGRLTPRRAVSMVQVPLSDVKAVRAAFGTTVNDVVLAASATTLRRWLLAHATLPGEPLIVAVPVDARSDGDGLGNHVANMMVQLDLGPEDPLARLAQAHEAAADAKAMLSALGTQSLQEMTAFAAPPVLTAGARLYSGLGLARLHRPVMNLIVSNVPGPPIDLYCAGARVGAIFPMGPVMEGTSMNVTVLSEADHLNVGVMACPDVVADVDQLGRGFAEAVAELLALAREAERAG